MGDTGAIIRPPAGTDSLMLRALALELNGALAGSHIQEVRQPGELQIAISLRAPGHTLTLLLSAEAAAARAHLVSGRPTTLPEPSTFCMAVRKHLIGARVTRIEQKDFDRVLLIQCSGADGSHQLIAELMGKQSNLALVDGAGVVIDAIKRISHRLNRIRETLPGRNYLWPPEQPDRVDPLAPGSETRLVRELASIEPSSPETLRQALMSIYAGMSPFLADQITLRALDKQARGASREEALQAAWGETVGAAAAARYSPVVIRDAVGRPIGAYPIPLVSLDCTPAASMSRALEEAFGSLLQRRELEERRSSVAGRLARELRWIEKQLEGCRQAARQAEREAELRECGDLILANLWRLHGQEERLSAEDYFRAGTGQREIALDPRRTGQENAQLYYQRARKARAAAQRASAAGEVLQQRLRGLRSAQNELPQLGTVEAVASLERELETGGLVLPAHPPEQPRQPTVPAFAGHRIRRYYTPEGYEILAGESATANDYLTTRVAAPNDYWLHVRAAASAHVVVRSGGRPDQVPRAVLERAAKICAAHSEQKHSSLVAVDYTLKRHVRKPRRSAPGGADYTHETTIEVAPGE